MSRVFAPVVHRPTTLNPFLVPFYDVRQWSQEADYIRVTGIQGHAVLDAGHGVGMNLRTGEIVQGESIREISVQMEAA